MVALSSSSRRLTGSDSLTRSLSRPGSSSEITDETIKAATQRFDVEAVFKLCLARRGLTHISGLERCSNLVDLDLSCGNVSKIEGLDSLVKLQRLNLSSNHISEVDNLWQLAKLESLKIHDNKISNIEALRLPQLAQLKALRVLWLQAVDRSRANAVCRLPGYKATVMQHLPQLSNLDGERSPGSLNYMELSAEMAALVQNPPPPRQVVLPEVQPWLAGVSTDLGGASSEDGGGRAEGQAQLEGASAAVVRKLDECQMLSAVLREEVVKAQASLAKHTKAVAE